MKIILSPAKSLNFNSPLPPIESTDCSFLKEAERINKILKKKSAKNLAKLMSISPDLSQLNYERNQDWELPFTSSNSRPALFTFSGDVFRGINTATIPSEKHPYLQKSIRIISGMYGILKPMDRMMAYRLEMKTKLPIGVKKNLYDFWKPKLTQALNEELKEESFLLNLASNEYFKAIDSKQINKPIITATFKDYKNGAYKTIMTFAKLARGYMTRYLIDHEIESIEDIKGFNYEGYGYNKSLSTENEFVFVR